MALDFDVRETVAATPEQVFAALTDLKGAKAWVPGFVRIEELTEGHFRVGTEWRETRKLFGKEATEQFEVTRCEPPFHISLRVDGSKGTSKRGEYLFDYALMPQGTETLVHLRGEIRGLSGVFALLGRLLIRPYEKACARDLRALKEHIQGLRA